MSKLKLFKKVIKKYLHGVPTFVGICSFPEQYNYSSYYKEFTLETLYDWFCVGYNQVIFKDGPADLKDVELAYSTLNSSRDNSVKLEFPSFVKSWGVITLQDYRDCSVTLYIPTSI